MCRSNTAQIILSRFDKVFLSQSRSIKGWTIRKLMKGGEGEIQKKYSRKGKLNEKKFMHAN